MLEELYVYNAYNLPQGGEEYHLIKDLFETGNLTSKDIDRLLELTAEHINALMKSKFRRPSKFSSEGSSSLKVQVQFIEKKIRMFDASTGEDITYCFVAMQERIVLSLSLIHAIRIVGSDECRRAPFVYDGVELFGLVEYLDHQDFKDFLDSYGSVEYKMQWRNSKNYGKGAIDFEAYEY